MKRKVVVCFLWSMMIFINSVYSCGGGMVPYVPTQSGTGKSEEKYFLMDKGVATDMFDVKNFNALFRNIILSGNERNKKNLEKTSKKQKSKSTALSKNENDSALKDSSDSAEQMRNVYRKSEAVPVLNLHRIH